MGPGMQGWSMQSQQGWWPHVTPPAGQPTPGAGEEPAPAAHARGTGGQPESAAETVIDAPAQREQRPHAQPRQAPSSGAWQSQDAAPAQHAPAPAVTFAAPEAVTQLPWRETDTQETAPDRDVNGEGTTLSLRARDLQDTIEVAVVVLPPGPEGQTTSDHTTMVGDSAILAAMRKRMAENSNSEEDIKALREGPGLAGAGGCRRTYQLPGHEEPVEEPRSSQRLEFPNNLGNIDVSHFNWLS